MMIAKKTIKFVTVLAFLFSSLTIFAINNDQDHESHHKESNQQHHSPVHHNNDDGRIDQPNEVVSYIRHHLKDSHDFHLYSYTSQDGERKHVGFSLPVIIWTSKGLKFFMSSEFHHDDSGSVVVNKDGVKLIKIHSKIYELQQGAVDLAFDEHHHPSNAHKVLDFSLTKSVFGILLAGLLLFLGFGALGKSYRKGAIPTGIGRFLEPLVLYVRDEIAIPNIGKKHYRRFMGFLLTVFFFIWVLNLLGLTPLGFNVTGQLAVTACLALFTFVIIQFSANKDYWKHIFWMPGVPVMMKFVLAPIEVLGMFTKPFSLMIRLFANMTAGHFVVMSLIALLVTLKNQFGVVVSTGMSFMLSLFITLIELLVAFLQAYIFTMLSALFIGMAVEEHDHH